MSKIPSSTTKPLALRLPNEVVTVLKRRAEKQGMKVSEYLKRRVIYDVKRKR